MNITVSHTHFINCLQHSCFLCCGTLAFLDSNREVFHEKTNDLETVKAADGNLYETEIPIFIKVSFLSVSSRTSCL